jgi:hypothetical protein
MRKELSTGSGLHIDGVERVEIVTGDSVKVEISLDDPKKPKPILSGWRQVMAINRLAAEKTVITWSPFSVLNDKEESFAGERPLESLAAWQPGYGVILEPTATGQKVQHSILVKLTDEKFALMQPEK